MKNEVAPKSPPPSIRLHGEHAKSLHGSAPGSDVDFHVKGKMQSSGFDEWDNKPFATVQLRRIIAKRKARRR